MQRKIKRIHEFWFGDDFTTVEGVEARRQKWFAGSKEFDHEIKRLFSGDLERAAAGEYAAWEDTSGGALALILVLDQFPRNIHRGAPHAFACDGPALALCLRMIEAGRDRELLFMERMFVAMPLQHAEDAAVQKRSDEWFTQWASEAPPGFEELAADSLQYAKLHGEIIYRFGRFPHRNAILGRESTAEESAYLESSGMDFGQSAG